MAFEIQRRRTSRWWPADSSRMISLITQSQSWGRLLEKDYRREDHRHCNCNSTTCRPSLSWILTRRQKWRRINCKSRLLSPTLNANAYEAHNQVRFTTSGVFGTAKLPCCERKQQTVSISFLWLVLGGLKREFVRLSTYNFVRKYAWEHTVPHLLPLFVAYGIWYMSHTCQRR